MPKYYVLLGKNGSYKSDHPGKLAGQRKQKIYGRLDCPSAMRAISRGGYVKNRVFFKNERSALACGYRPCAVCLPIKYQKWKNRMLSSKGITHK